VACDGDGLPCFERLRHRRQDAAVFLVAFDLLELDGQDLRREPFETRKATLAPVLRRAGAGIQLNEHLDHDDALAVFEHACRMGMEGIVSKRLGSPARAQNASLGRARALVKSTLQGGSPSSPRRFPYASQAAVWEATNARSPVISG
jgi:hypothetical protein